MGLESFLGESTESALVLEKFDNEKLLTGSENVSTSGLPEEEWMKDSFQTMTSNPILVDEKITVI